MTKVETNSDLIGIIIDYVPIRILPSLIGVNKTFRYVVTKLIDKILHKHLQMIKESPDTVRIRGKKLRNTLLTLPRYAICTKKRIMDRDETRTYFTDLLTLVSRCL